MNTTTHQRAARLHCGAFTLIESLAALMLGTLLALGALAMTRSIAHAPALNAPPFPSPELMRLLQWDLVNARRFANSDDGLALWGMGWRDAAMVPTHRPARVVYRIDTIAGAPWLERSERAGNWQLICPDVSAISLRLVKEPSKTAADDESDVASETSAGPGQALGRTVQIQLMSARGEVAQRDICLR